MYDYMSDLRMVQTPIDHQNDVVYSIISIAQHYAYHTNATSYIRYYLSMVHLSLIHINFTLRGH